MRRVKPIVGDRKSPSFLSAIEERLARLNRSGVLILRKADEILTLQGAAKKSGRRPEEADLDRLQSATMVAVGGTIVWVGRDSKLPKLSSLGFGRSRSVREVSAVGRVVMPALAECHTHLLFSGDRASEFERRLRGESYAEIAKSGGGISVTVSATRRAAEAELVRDGAIRAQSFLRQGVGTLECKSGYGLSHDQELKLLEAVRELQNQTPIRLISTYLGPHSRSPERPDPNDYIQEIVDRTLPAIAKKKLADRADIFIEEGYFNGSQGRSYLNAAKSAGLELVIHADQFTRSGGAELAVEMEARSADHVICVSKKDINQLARSETTAVLLPTADYYLSIPYPKARLMIDAGVRVALATDFNPGSSPTRDIGFVGLLARREMKMTWTEVLVAYTVGASHALGLGSRLGAIEKGRWADLAILERGPQELFYAPGISPVREMVIGGQYLKLDGKNPLRASAPSA